ncbi:hypothetical protein ANN_00320 [Periplaneta americana]|uniref:C2H2-type domain-containing protein n=1 Tax=Periplaneta americana TaxID=6978 RepID=A0ABQ8TRL0_PERAM|nr:hypothetical protein ANN_00320 [Periplaneta americana]
MDQSATMNPGKSEEGNIMNVADVLVCLWQYCGFESADTKEIVRHVNFHSYHTKIKCIGSNMLARSKIPACTFDPDGRNLAPELPDMFACCWADCERVFNNSQMYFYHVDAHVQNNPRGKNVEGGISCLWRSCRSVFRSVYKLADHVRSHTQEKLVGCPTCGGLFASKTKFFDHCKRQVPLELLGYQCSHCSKYYPSERLLRDHMRHHVNHYKCTFCDMTCPTPSSLASHIRYRHIDSKPFKCNFCEYTGKTHYDLRHHLNTHCSDPLYQCDEEGCNYSCRSAYGLERHYRREGMSVTMLQILFKSYGAMYATPESHNLHCNNYRYKHDEDGYFRLQTVRYESLEVTQEMMQSESGDNTEQVYTDKSYNLRRMNNGNEFIFSEDEDEDDPKVHESSGGRILISVEELDGCGNVVNTKLMEAVEVPSLPPGTVTVIHDGGEVAEEIIPN